MPGWGSGCFGSFKRDDECSYNKQYALDLPNEENRPSTFFNNDKGKFIVELAKKDNMILGLIISGGIDKVSKPQIVSLRPGSIAHRSDALAVGDKIISINGIQTSKFKHEDIINVLINARTKITLEIEYEYPIYYTLRKSTVSKVIQIKLEKERESFGFTLREGVYPDKRNSKALTITHVRFGGPAYRTGIIQPGDRLLAVDGINLSYANLQNALQVIKYLKQASLFTIEYDISFIDAVKNSTGPLLIEINKTPDCVLGLNLSCIYLPERAMIIESIRQASVAERCGALHVGDHVLAIDGIKVNSMSPPEAMQLLKSSTEESVKLEVLPFTQISMKTSSEIQSKRGMVSSSYYDARSSFSNDCCNTLSSLGGATCNCSNPHASIISSRTHRQIIDEGNPHNRMTTISADISNMTLNSGSKSVAHSDRTEVILNADHTGFGFDFQILSCLSDTMSAPPFISYIEPDSPAERSGVMQVGDRILAINSETTEGMSTIELKNMISNSKSRIVLIIDFDVAEAVIPSSGTFLVKLAKTSGGIGISVTAPRNGQFGEPLLIADIKKGSVSHRTGSIQPGDKLLAINSLRTENCTVEDASVVLNSPIDIVKLRIRKNDAFSEDPDATCAVIYTVELVRHGGPLGITVSSTKEPFDPIYISGLMENGLAERTGALHIGDRILAINGKSLCGKTLNEAVCILQTCGDIITLKISKCPCAENIENDYIKSKPAYCTEENQSKSLVKPLSSIDSAFDSWNSSNFTTALDAATNKTEPSSSDNTIEQSTNSNVKEFWKNNFSNSSLEEETYETLREIEQNLDEMITNSNLKIYSDTENELLNLNLSTKQPHSINNCLALCENSLRHSMCVDPSVFSASLPIEIHKVTLFKDQVYEDFGFSLSDSEYESDGVYINSIRPGGPAHQSGLIKPLDRILQVNNVKTYNAGLIVPLIASSGDRIELLISRPAYENVSLSDEKKGFSFPETKTL